MWHTDSSYRPMPSVGSLLHGIEISRTGGITQFINMYMVYDELPESLRRQVEGRKARHDFSMLSPARGLAAADAGGAGRDAAGLASHGAAPSRQRTEVALYQLDLQRCRRRAGRAAPRSA